jgi:hypothetical protein
MSRAHVFLGFMHPDIESARKVIQERLDEGCRISRRPTSIGELLGKAKWENRLDRGNWCGAPWSCRTGFRSRTGGEEQWMATGAGV